MKECKLTCDRCGEVGEFPADIAAGDRFVGLQAVSLDGRSVAFAHVCRACFAVVVEILPKMRQHFGELTSHVAQVMGGTGDTRVAKGTCAQVTDRIGDDGAFAVSRIVLDRPADWKIHRVEIGNRGQMVDSHRLAIGSLPGSRFAEDAPDNGFAYETCQPRMDFVVAAEYVGDNPEGGKLAYTIHGRRVGFAPAPATTTNAGDPR